MWINKTVLLGNSRVKCHSHHTTSKEHNKHKSPPEKVFSLKGANHVDC